MTPDKTSNGNECASTKQAKGSGLGNQLHIVDAIDIQGSAIIVNRLDANLQRRDVRQ